MIKHPAQHHEDPPLETEGAPVEPFRLMTEARVVRWTGYIADSLPALARGLQQVPGSSIYYHVHHAIFRRRKHRLAENTNDFASWIFTRPGLQGLAEKLSSLNPLEYTTIREARECLVAYARSTWAKGKPFPGYRWDGSSTSWRPGVLFSRRELKPPTWNNWPKGSRS